MTRDDLTSCYTLLVITSSTWVKSTTEYSNIERCHFCEQVTKDCDLSFAAFEETSCFGEAPGARRRRKWQPTPVFLLRIPWTEAPGWLLSIGLRRVGHNWSDLSCMHALEKEMATHSSIFAWRIPGTEEPGGLPSMGSHSQTRLKRLSSSSWGKELRGASSQKASKEMKPSVQPQPSHFRDWSFPKLSAETPALVNNLTEASWETVEQI